LLLTSTGKNLLATLVIPKNVRDGLALLREVSDGVFNTLLVDLEQSVAASSSVQNLSPTDAKQLIDAITSMSAVRASAGVSLDQFIADVCESLREEEELTSTQEPAFRERLAKALSIEILNVKAKALALSNEHEHLFCSARIFTDMRPIYGEDPSQPPEAMTITHILKIHYHAAGNRIHEIYLGIGSSDIEEFREVLDRAEKKAESIRALLESSKIRFIDPQQ
jgi:hypothetical protein